MRIIDWLREMANGGSERLPPSSFIHLLTEKGDDGGVILVHSDETRDILIRRLTFQSTTDVTLHKGTISPYFADQLGAASGLINAAIQSGQLLQIIGSPQIAAGLQTGSLTIMRSAGQMTGTVVSNATQKIAGQLRFGPANITEIVGPLAVWQILNAVASVQHLQRIDTKLESIQRGIDRLTFRIQAKTYGQLMSAVATLEEISKQHTVTGTFSQDMIIKLALAERDIRSALVEQQLLMQRFGNIKDQILRKTNGKLGAFKANQILKEETDEFLVDAKLLTAAFRASILASEAWIRHDLEHNPRHVSMRLHDLNKEMDAIIDAISPLGMLEELQRHAVDCLAEMNWFSRNIFNRQLKSEIESRISQSEPEQIQPNAGIPSVVVWKDHDNVTKSVVIEVAVEK